jgi:hypothetical protein
MNLGKYFEIYSGCIACHTKERTRVGTATLLRNLTVRQQADRDYYQTSRHPVNQLNQNTVA